MQHGTGGSLVPGFSMPAVCCATDKDLPGSHKTPCDTPALPFARRQPCHDHPIICSSASPGNRREWGGGGGKATMAPSHPKAPVPDFAPDRHSSQPWPTGSFPAGAGHCRMPRALVSPLASPRQERTAVTLQLQRAALRKGVVDG